MTVSTSTQAPTSSTRPPGARRSIRRRAGLLLTVVATATATAFGAAGTAQAAPATTQIDPVQGLIAAGVPAQVARQAAVVKPASADGVVPIAHPGRQFSFPGTEVDAVVDPEQGSVTVVQRWLSGPSGLSVGWTNLGNGRSGVTGLSDVVPVPDDIHYGSAYADHAATLATGGGHVALVVWGQIPGWTGLIPLAPEYFGIMTPSAALLRV
ncbi:hypothetical protein G4X40_20070 [Rhodococcus sp. D2-41]|uniref:hypothetical protein n=1 Tax=Speluncibacter jeojiensis TaxID=2710754 RepID=UPI00240F3CE1|nr:hypothetical protein [Rhodococcus sp. D2-41]MDG3012441.1 hypothetical protein [Rhodococcus sp. D2-41]